MNDRLKAVLRPVVRLLPPLWRVHLRRWWNAGHALGVSLPDYEGRIRQEVSRFSEEEVLNDLPGIFHYWSGKYLRPKLEAFCFSYPVEIPVHEKPPFRSMRSQDSGAWEASIPGHEKPGFRRM